MRPSDTLARIGGNEFVAMLEDVSSQAAARRIAERLIDATSRSVRASGTRERITTVSFSTAPVVLPRVQRVVERRRLGEHGHRIVRRTSWFDGS
jgi:GGDEF domain-containing protein